MEDDAFQVQPIDALLAGYAAGGLSAPLTALVEAHLELKPESRRFVADLTALSGVLLDQVAPAPLVNRARVLARAVMPVAEEMVDAPAPVPGGDVLPAPLLRLIGRDPRELAWHWVVPGLRECPILVGPGLQASLMHVKAGAKLPTHTHTGDEFVLVLDGSFSDEHGQYRRGDIEIADETFSHRPMAGRDSDCLFFLVRDGPVKLTGPIGRIIQLFRRDES